MFGGCCCQSNKNSKAPKRNCFLTQGDVTMDERGGEILLTEISEE